MTCAQPARQYAPDMLGAVIPLATPLEAEPPAQRTPRIALEVSWARLVDEVREAQRLRYSVFAGEMGALIQTPLPLHDVDRFDDFCEHLLVRECEGGQVVGTYRLLAPDQALRAGATYCDGEFDLSPLAHLRPGMVELGRSCVHPRHRQGGVIIALWTQLAHYMYRHRLQTMIGCASIPMRQDAPGHGDSAQQAAASVWHQLRVRHMADPAFRVRARLPLPVDGPPAAEDAPIPALIRGYIGVGAKLLGAPAWDAQFNTADLPMLLRMEDLPRRYLRMAPGA